VKSLSPEDGAPKDSSILFEAWDGSESLVRFDVFSIRISDGDNLIEHIAEAF
jgi:hypothetical protein